MPRVRLSRVALSAAIALTLGLAACGGDDSTDTGSQGTATATGDSAPAQIPAEVCDIVSAEDVGAILGETVRSTLGPQGSCTYNSENATVASLSPTIYLEDAALYDITGLGEPITVDGHDGYLSPVGNSPEVFHGVIIVDGVYIEVVVNTTDLAAETDHIEALLSLTAKAL